MNKKELEKKAIDFKGKKYILVADRVIYFNDNYKNGSIRTELVSTPESKDIIVKATVIPDIAIMERKFTGYSQATVGKGYINQTSALENAETSAIGRALAMMAIGLIDFIASADEMKKAGEFPTEMENAFKANPTPTVVQWEEMTAEEQQLYKNKQLEVNRAKYAENKGVGAIKRKRCEDCGAWNPINATECKFCADSVVGVGDEKIK